MPPGEPAWGIMVSEGRNNLIDFWWLSLIPGLAITSVVIAMNLFGDWLRGRMRMSLREASATKQSQEAQIASRCLS